jgi:hypothetical protein
LAEVPLEPAADAAESLLLQAQHLRLGLEVRPGVDFMKPFRPKFRDKTYIIWSNLGTYMT